MLFFITTLIKSLLIGVLILLGSVVLANGNAFGLIGYCIAGIIIMDMVDNAERLE